MKQESPLMNNSKLRSLWSAGHNVYFKKNQHNNHTILSLTCDRNQHVYELSKNQAKSFFDRFVNAVCFTINDAYSYNGSYCDTTCMNAAQKK